MFTNRCHVMFDKFAMLNWWWVLLCKETNNEFSHLVFNSTSGMVSMNTSASLIFALELAETTVHMQMKWVYAGALEPPSLSQQCRLSHTYLPVKSFIPLITGQWLYQQTASGVFLHAFYTDYMDYCITRFWWIIFNVIALKLKFKLLFSLSFF